MKHKFITYALILPITALFVSCLPEGSAVYSYTGAWGTVEYDSKTGENYVRPDFMPLTTNSLFTEATSGNRVVIDYSIDASKYIALPSGEACYQATVSNFEEIPLENVFRDVRDTTNMDQFGKHPFDNLSLYTYIVPNSNKRQIMSVAIQYTGADDTYPIKLLCLRPMDKSTTADTVKFEIRCDNEDKKGTRPYLLYHAYDITNYLDGSEKKVVQLSYMIKLSSGNQIYKNYITWLKPKEE